MKYPDNIEPSKYGKKYRIGYDKGGQAWRIFGETCKYYATPINHNADWTMIQSGTLAGVSAALLQQCALVRT